MDDVLQKWTAAVKADLGIDLEVDRALLLALASFYLIGAIFR